MRHPWTGVYLAIALTAAPAGTPAARAAGSEPPACARILAAVAADIEALGREIPKLEAFRAAGALRDGRCVVSYAHKTHRPTHRGGWSACFPAPDRDGLAFHIHLYLRDEEAGQIDTQPVMPPWRLAGHRVTFLLLEGEDGPEAEAPIYQILRLHGLRIEGQPDLEESARRLDELAGREGRRVLLGGTARTGGDDALVELADGGRVRLEGVRWPAALLGKSVLALGRLRGAPSPPTQALSQAAEPQAVTPQRDAPPAAPPSLEAARFRAAE
jgi:hypothetical protein